MSTQDNLNMAGILGNTAAGLLAQPVSSKIEVANAVNGLITALANKARSLLGADEIKVEVTMGAGDFPNIPVTMGSNADRNWIDEMVEQRPIGPAGDHYSDCATNNRGVPELLGPCDCAHAPCMHTPKTAETNTLTGFSSEALHGYLRRAVLEKSAIDHVIRVVCSTELDAECYIRPLNTDGETLQFAVTCI